jgi:hypothetical protein
MTEQELRQLVRGVIAGRDVQRPPDPTAIPLVSLRDPISLRSLRDHASHGLFVIPAQGESCIIEPTVSCNHCGYCKSYGH